jgi:hypothetical protein
MTKMVQPYEGQVVYFEPARNFGYLSEVGSTTKKYFFHTSRIIGCECAVQDIEVGMLAKFDISPVPPRVGNLPYVINLTLHKAAVGLTALAEAASDTQVAQ